MTSLLKNYASFTSHTKPTVGDLKMSAVTVDHLGWLLCDGRPLLVSEWRFLFNIIGYQFGGSGNTFWLPDARGRVAGAVNQGPGLTNRPLGTTVGTETHTLTIAEIPAHKHGSVDVSGNTNGDGSTTINGAHNHTGSTGNAGIHSHDASDLGHTHGYFNQPNQHEVAVSLTTTDTADNINVNQNTNIGYANIIVESAGDHNHTISTDGNHAHTMGSTGGGDAHNNMQPTLFMGNQFIYSGKPTYGTWPLTYSPPSLGPYGGQTQIQ